MDALEPLVGDWEVHLVFPAESGLGEMHGITTFAWTLGGAFLMMTSSADNAALPRALCLIGTKGDAFLQHYFDSRGVVRQYDMTFADGVWTLERDDADFAQSFRAELSDDGSEMRGAWRRTEKGAWIHDFDVTYRLRG